MLIQKRKNLLQPKLIQQRMKLKQNLKKRRYRQILKQYRKKLRSLPRML